MTRVFAAGQPFDLGDPTLRSRCVEIPNELGLTNRLAGIFDPDVRAPALDVPMGSEQVADELAVPDRCRSGAFVHFPERLDLRAIVDVLGQAGLGLSLACMALLEQV